MDDAGPSPRRPLDRVIGRVLVAVAVTVGLAAALSACNDPDLDLDRADPDPTTTTEDPSPPDDPPSEVAGLDWQACDGSGECATLAVPLDHDDPDGATIDVFVRRLPARGERIGALFMNFGGPGADAASLIDAFPVPDEVRERFDIVGMDPRGVGRSTNLECGLPANELYSVDPTIDSPEDRDALLEVSERYADDCQDRAADLLPHLGTRDVARDMDAVREAMGDETLSYLGYSYGTSLGQAYAELFPERIRAMILDGVVDTAPSGIEVAVTQARGFETALANWAQGCPTRASCRLDDPLAAIDRVINLAEGGIPAGDEALTPGPLAIGLAYPLYNEALWSSLDRAVDDALSADGRGLLDLADSYAGLADFDIYFAVSCLDSTWPTDVDVFLDAAAAANDEAPRFGEALVNDYIRCAIWPAAPDPLGAIAAPDAPPILVVSTTGDPATPYENGVVVAGRLPSAALLSYDGEGHTIVFQGDACVDEVATRYLVDAVAPDDGTC